MTFDLLMSAWFVIVAAVAAWLVWDSRHDSIA